MDTFHVYEDRSVPDNFDPSVVKRFKQLPPDALPQRAGSGKFNFTIKGLNGATVEVQLKHCKFYFKKLAGGHEVESKPTVAWSLYPSLDACWLDVKRMVQWA